MNQPTAFIDFIEIVVRASQVADADWASGMTYGASNAPGIGIATDNPGLTASLPSWTLLDQDGGARTPQVSQVIGGGGSQGTSGKSAEPVAVVENSTDGSGAATILGAGNLVSLAAGWSNVATLAIEEVTGLPFESLADEPDDSLPKRKRSRPAKKGDNK